MASPLLHASPASGFDDASRLVLRHVYDEIGFDSCLLTRIEGDDWIVLQVHGRGRSLVEGDVLSYTDSLCTRMVQGHGPCIALEVAAIEAYASAPVVGDLGVAAYVGVPIVWENGMLFGTLCAFDVRPAPAIVEHSLPLLRLLSRLLGNIVVGEVREYGAQRRRERLELLATGEHAAGPVGARAWEQALAHEERRCKTLGSTASVIAVRTRAAGAGDATADLVPVVTDAVRPDDVVVALDGDTIGVLLPECKAGAAERILGRVQVALSSTEVEAGAALAARSPRVPLAAAWVDAAATADVTPAAA
jgi:diguanylate cyclase